MTNIEIALLLGALLVLISIIASLCSCYWTYIFTNRMKEFGTFSGKGYLHNLFIRHFVSPPRKVREERRNNVLSEREIDEKMEVSRLTHPEHLKEDYDAIIIGSGISAMTTAGFLSRAGKKCLILESHDRFGGSCHTYEGNGYVFSPLKQFICDGDNPLLKWTFDIISEGSIKIESEEQEREIHEFKGEDSVELKGNQSLPKLERDLSERFPYERDGITRFFHYAKDCSGSYEKFNSCRHLPSIISYFYRAVLGWEENFHHYGQYTADEILDFCEIEDEALRTVLTSNQSLLSSHPQEEFMFPLCVRMLEIGWKKSRITGGSGEIPRQVIPRLKNESKAVHTAKVVSILCHDDGSVFGVELESGERILAEYIISSAGIQNTYYMLPKLGRRKTRGILKEEVFKEFEHTGFSFTIHIGLPGRPIERDGLTFLHAMTDRGETHDKMVKELRPPDFDAFEDCYEITISTDYDNLLNRTLLVISTPCFREWFKSFEFTESGKRPAEYYLWKERLAKKVLRVCFRKFRNLEKIMSEKKEEVYMDTATNLTTKNFLGSSEGSRYGFQPSYEKLDFVTGNGSVLMPLPKLYIIGKDIAMSGVLPTLMSCFPAVGDIIGRNMYWDFKMAGERHEKILSSVLKDK